MSNPTIRLFDAGDRNWLVEQHRTLYARDEGFDATFAALVAQIIDGFLASHDARCERGWIAEQGGARLGSIFCARETDGTARLRLFLLVPEARGRGLGKKLLQTCMSFAQDAGYCRMILSTHESHRAAGGLYKATGWHLDDVRSARSFGRNVVEQNWSYQF